jgi:hypothetical protein
MPPPSRLLDQFVTWAQILGALFVAVSLFLTSCQIRDAKEVFRGTTIYNLEKDWRDLFEKTTSPSFAKCFAPAKDESTFAPQPVCVEESARNQFLRLIDYYALLMSLERHDALTKEDVDERLQGGCRFLTSTGGSATLKNFKETGLIKQALISRIESTCGKGKGQ